MKTLSEIVRSYKQHNTTIFKDSEKSSRQANLPDKLESHYNFDNLSADEYEHIKDYTGANHHSINNALWEHHMKAGNLPDRDNIHHPEHYRHNIMKNIDSVLNKFKTPESFSVYSGIKSDFKPEHNKEYEHPGYLSTSLDKHTAVSMAKIHWHGPDYNQETPFDKHVLHIQVPKDHPGAYVNHISNHDEEKEFILPRGTKLKHVNTTTYKTYNYIKNRDYTNDEDDNGDDTRLVHFHHMRIVT